MPRSRTSPSRWLARRGTAVACGPALALLCGCAAADRTARQDVESLQTNVQQMESSLQARQAGVYEQIRELREEQNRLERLLEENGRQTKAGDQKLERLRERTQEEFDSRDKIQRDSAQAAAEQLSRLGARTDGLQKDLQKGFQTINDNLVALSAFEKKQEERIARIQEQFQSQLKVVVEEVGQENQGLVRSLAAVRADLETVRQESAANRQGLVDLQGSLQQFAEKLAAAQKQIQDAARRQEAARKTAPARGGQHSVRAGETLTTIAARYGVSVQALMENNQISDANSIREGQKLAIPEP
ncbi:MAG: LysM peptidoglycan-binding domain-containing protein [Candidatus Methylomirabilia bacterium]